MLKYNYWFWIYCLILVIRCAHIEANVSCKIESVSFIEEQTLRNFTFDSFVRFRGTVKSRSHCASVCGIATVCVSFIYNTQVASCTTYSVIFDDTTDGFLWTGAHYYVNAACDATCYENTTLMTTNKTCGEEPCPACPGHYTYETSSGLCYRIDQSSADKTDAVAVCQTEGGHLVKVDSQAKQDVLKAALQTAYNPNAKNKYYISGKKVSGVYTFDDGTAIPYFYWGASGTSESHNGILMSDVYNYDWKPTETQFRRNFICEIDV